MFPSFIKYPVLLISVLAIFSSCSLLKDTSQPQQKYIKCAVDLVHIENDRIKVHLTPASIFKDHAIFYIPETVPGTYTDDDYGQFVDSLRVFSQQGRKLEVKRTSENTWEIPESKKIGFIEYYVNDTFDSEDAHDVFSPAGTNFKENYQFLLNLHSIIGYFKNQEDLPYYLDILSPSHLYSTTSLALNKEATYVKSTFNNDDALKKTRIDTYRADRYFDIIDNPILYNQESAVNYKVDGISVALSVHSPTGLIQAEDLQLNIEKMMKAQKRYLGDLKTTSFYTILLYLTDGTLGDAQDYGALEHHTSTVVILPEQMPLDEMNTVLLDVISHEFFHILTPLNLHSTQIHKFKYNDPEMSRHLWLYEGVTEYFAQHFQVSQGLITADDFYNKILKKIEFSTQYNDAMSFTRMSERVLSEPYASNYGNVYEKGALIGMCLDILMRKLSQGERGLLDLIKELMQLYGPDRPFEDRTFIPEITRRTYPEIGEFFNNHVIGSTPIHYQDFFDMVGLEYQAQFVDTSFFINGTDPFINANEYGEIYVLPITLNTFFERMGIQAYDVIKSINNTTYNINNAAQLINDSTTWELGAPITFVINRDGKEIVLNGKVSQPQLRKPRLEEVETSGQTDLEIVRNTWLKGS